MHALSIIGILCILLTSDRRSEGEAETRAERERETVRS